MSREILYRAAFMRGAPQGRRVTYTAATEAAVDTGFGREVLRMSGCDLSDYDRNPVVLDAHRRGSCSDVIGKASARVEGRELVADVDYLEDEDAERVFRKVQAGAIRAVSVGYVVDESSVRRVRAGETVDGVEGPAVIVGRWKLLEISNVPVPADANALRRQLYTRALAGDQEASMEDDEKKDPEAPEGAEGEKKDDEAEPTPGDRARELMAEAEELGITRAEMAEATDREEEDLEELAEGEGDEAPEDLLEALAELIEAKRKRMAEEEAEREAEAADEGEDGEKKDPEAERKRRTIKARRAAFVAAAPAALRGLAEDVFLSPAHRRSQTAIWSDAVEIAPAWAKQAVLDVIRANPTAKLDHYRRELLKLRAKRMAPAGTPAAAPASADRAPKTTTNPAGDPASTPKAGDLAAFFG